MASRPPSEVVVPFKAKLEIEPEHQIILERFEEIFRQHLSELFPGDPARADRLGTIYHNIIHTVQLLPEPDRMQMQKALATALRPLKPVLPHRPPKKWSKRDPSSKISPADFTRDIYSQWIGAGLNRRHLNQIDPALYKALSVWESRHPDQRLKELPTLAEEIDLKVASLAGELTPDELRTLGTTLQTRYRRALKMS